MFPITENDWTKVLAFDADFRARNNINGRTCRYHFITKAVNGMPVVLQVAVRRQKGCAIQKKVVAYADTATHFVGIGDMEYRGCAGWIVDWFSCSPMHYFSVIPWHWHCASTNDLPLVNPEALAETAAAKCGWNKDHNLINYLMLWSNDKRVEFVAKAGLTSLCNPSCIGALAKNHQFFRFVREHGDEIRTGNWGSQEVRWAFSNRRSLEDARSHYSALKTMRMSGFVAGYGAFAEKIVAYSFKARIGLAEYSRYLEDAKSAGWNTEDPRVMFPPPAHFTDMAVRAESEAAKAAKKAERMKRFEVARKMREFAKRFDFGKSVCGYAVFVPMSVKALVAEGKTMNNCVGRMGYDRKVADRKSLIVALRRGGKSVCTIEIAFGKTIDVRQCYAQKNSPATPAMKRAAETICKMAKKQLKAKKEVA